MMIFQRRLLPLSFTTAAARRIYRSFTTGCRAKSLEQDTRMAGWAFWKNLNRLSADGLGQIKQVTFGAFRGPRSARGGS